MAGFQDKIVYLDPFLKPSYTVKPSSGYDGIRTLRMVYPWDGNWVFDDSYYVGASDYLTIGYYFDEQIFWSTGILDHYADVGEACSDPEVFKFFADQGKKKSRIYFRTDTYWEGYNDFTWPSLHWQLTDAFEITPDTRDYILRCFNHALDYHDCRCILKFVGHSVEDITTSYTAYLVNTSEDPQVFYLIGMAADVCGRLIAVLDAEGATELIFNAMDPDIWFETCAEA